MTRIRLRARIERFPVAGRFTIARGSTTKARVIGVTLTRNGLSGTGECVPYARYGQSLDETLALIRAQAPALAEGLDRAGLQQRLPPGPARNALDCALWALEAREAGTDVATLASVSRPARIETAFTISLDTPEAMASTAARVAHLPLLKLKLGAAGDSERLRAVRAAAPHARLIIDANEGWRAGDLPQLLAVCAEVGVELVEQPLPASDDAALATIARPIPVCADESAHALAGLDALVDRYDAINIKLDKTGGLTEALAVARRAEALGLRIMVGCMLSTSLSMLPATLIAPFARWVDLDGPLLLAKDRPGGLSYSNGIMDVASSTLWG